MTGYGQFCSMARAHEVLGGRWTLLIVREILSGSRRFNGIRRGIPRVSRTVLSERLQALVFVGPVARTDGPHGPEYELTKAGQELAMLVSVLGTWGSAGWRASQPTRTSIWSRCWSTWNGESALRPCPRSPSWCGLRFVATKSVSCCSRRLKLQSVIATRVFPSRCAC